MRISLLTILWCVATLAWGLEGSVVYTYPLEWPAKDLAKQMVNFSGYSPINPTTFITDYDYYTGDYHNHITFSLGPKKITATCVVTSSTKSGLHDGLNEFENYANRIVSKLDLAMEEDSTQFPDDVPTDSANNSDSGEPQSDFVDSGR